jgi:hypothetical protein
MHPPTRTETQQRLGQSKTERSTSPTAFETAELYVRSSVATVLLVCAIAIAAGCTTTGVGYGDVPKGGGEQLAVSWTSSDGGISGTMTASLSDGRSFSGPFFEMTSQTVAPFWYGSGFYGWGDGTGSSTPFRTHYSGSVVADLAGENNVHMRCRLRLLTPRRGISGGGAGECQVTGNAPIEVRFAAT